jgi:hypothetical protein
LITDEGAQYRDDSGLVAGRVLHQALKRIDPAEPDLNGRTVAKVGNGGVVTVGELSLFRDLQLLGVGEEGYERRDECGDDNCDT